MNKFAYVQFTGRHTSSAKDSSFTAPRRMCSRRAIPPVATHGDESRPLNEFLSSILVRNNLPHDAYRANALERRLPAVQRNLRVNDLKQAHKRLEKEPELLPQLLSILLIGVTGFFRDSGVFDFLAKQLLPEMVAERKSLRVLSAGTSRGHELYSVAMLLEDLHALEDSELLGVDCRPEAIKGARAGRFSEKDVEALDNAIRQRYFQQSRNGWEVLSGLREQLEWRVEDILKQVPAGPWDLILFRNVAIYLKTDYAYEVWERLCRNTRVGGLIVTGKADQPPPSLPLQRIITSIYRRVA